MPVSSTFVPKTRAPLAAAASPSILSRSPDNCTPDSPPEPLRSSPSLAHVHFQDASSRDTMHAHTHTHTTLLPDTTTLAGAASPQPSPPPEPVSIEACACAARRCLSPTGQCPFTSPLSPPSTPESANDWIKHHEKFLDAAGVRLDRSVRKLLRLVESGAEFETFMRFARQAAVRLRDSCCATPKCTAVKVRHVAPEKEIKTGDSQEEIRCTTVRRFRFGCGGTEVLIKFELSVVVTECTARAAQNCVPEEDGESDCDADEDEDDGHVSGDEDESFGDIGWAEFSEAECDFTRVEVFEAVDLAPEYELTASDSDDEVYYEAHEPTPNYDYSTSPDVLPNTARPSAAASHAVTPLELHTPTLEPAKNSSPEHILPATPEPSQAPAPLLPPHPKPARARRSRRPKPVTPADLLGCNFLTGPGTWDTPQNRVVVSGDAVGRVPSAAVFAAERRRRSVFFAPAQAETSDFGHVASSGYPPSSSSSLYGPKKR